MNQPQLSPRDYARSVVAVPPIALTPEGAVAVEANRRLLDHIAAGGIEAVLYGGNANLYHYGAKMYREALEVLFEACPASVRLLFSIGPDFGKAMDQADVILEAGVRNVLILPTAFPSDPRGVAEGARRIADRLGFGVVLYVKRDRYIDADDLARLVEEGSVSFVKYAVERPTPENDDYLDSLVAAVGIERISSGMGETPIADHIGRRRLATFTSGAVCIAPAAANELLALYRAGSHDEAGALSAPFLEFERQRTRLGGTAVLHDAVTLSGIADCGPLLPMLSNLAEEAKVEIRAAIGALLAAEDAARSRTKAA